MDEHYCPMCGEHHAGETPAEAEAAAVIETAAEITSAEVEIARINAKRDVDLARISAGMADAERDQELAHAEGVIDGMRDVVETVAPEPEPAPEPDPEVVVVNAPEADADANAEDAPPEHGSAPPEAEPKRSRSLGMW